MKNLSNSKLVKIIAVFFVALFIWVAMYHAFAFTNAEYLALKWDQDTRFGFAFISMIILFVATAISSMIYTD